MREWLPTIVSALLIPLFGWIVRMAVLDAIKELRASNERQGSRLGELEKFRAVVEDRLGRARRMTDSGNGDGK